MAPDLGDVRNWKINKYRMDIEKVKNRNPYYLYQKCNLFAKHG
jgi:hypothetical protein